MDKNRNKSEIDAAERAEIFHEQYGNFLDAASVLPDLVIAAGDYISRIVGTEITDAGMALIVSELVQISGGTIEHPENWRSSLTASRSNCFSEWSIGAALHDLAAYAEYGIVLHESDDPDELAAHIQMLLGIAQDIEARTPFLQWGLEPNNDLTRLVILARNRWALDNQKPIEPTALAKFGGVTEGRIRNMMSGANKAFSSEDGRIPADEALKWLIGRPDFWASIWRGQSLPRYAPSEEAPIHDVIFVPVARDGSVFHPGLRRGSSYTVGQKGQEQQIADFNEALIQLQRMPVPYWRRPNASGNWGSVVGIRWERMDASQFQSNSEMANHRSSIADEAE